jgi:sphingosine-1-phosphate phosphatase 1
VEQRILTAVNPCYGLTVDRHFYFVFLIKPVIEKSILDWVESDNIESCFRYDVDLWLGVVCIVIWVAVISTSRVYLGMHSVLDVVLGVFMTLILLVILLPLTDLILNFFTTNAFGPLAFVVLPVFLIVYFPTSEEWTPTRWDHDLPKKIVIEILDRFRGDTCTIAAVLSGIELGTWFSYQLGIFHKTQEPYPLSLDIGSYYTFAARTFIGLAIVGLTEFLGKYVSLSFLCFALNQDKKLYKSSENSVTNTKKNFIDLTSKYFTYCVLGFNAIVLVPLVFNLLHIQRDRFYHEL